ncbi:hypothetical protein DPMN_161429 [Dreissena polymorpha]|uniref:Uncharacterized protein n=1 Tax=Dreissena polymorpha TaxID=45954 RepID=A0A9D4ES65_DREPO|nr:hypothetical protein DPMN_161429 [Dreissena polymorpha]
MTNDTLHGSHLLSNPTAYIPRFNTALDLNSCYIIGTNFLTKFHEDRKINVASRVLTRKNAPPPGSHVFKPTGIIMNLLNKFHEDRTVNVASKAILKNSFVWHNPTDPLK